MVSEMIATASTSRRDQGERERHGLDSRRLSSFGSLWMDNVIASKDCRPRRHRPLRIAVEGLNCMIDITLVIAFMRMRARGTLLAV